MGEFLDMGRVARLAGGIAAWRLAAEVEAERRALEVAGQLAPRIAARRRARIERALWRDVEGVDEWLVARWTRAWADGDLRNALGHRVAVPVQVPVHDGAASTSGGRLRGQRGRLDLRMHAAMHAGALALGDVDDMSLLDGSMRRAADDGLELGHRGVERRTARERIAGAHPAWLALGVLGVLLTILPLVRPLSSAAPLLAGAGAILAAIAWFGASRRDRR